MVRRVALGLTACLSLLACPSVAHAGMPMIYVSKLARLRLQTLSFFLMGLILSALGSITDGLSQTLLFGEAAGNYRPWGYPANWRDPTIGLNRSPDGFGNAQGRGANIAFIDGDVRFLSNKISPKVLKALSTPAGGEKVDPVGQ